jgi:hypothetical protein
MSKNDTGEKSAGMNGTAYDRDIKRLEVHAKQIEAFSLAAMRAPALASVGGIVAILGFYSANYTRLHDVAGKLETVNSILFWFFLSAFLAVLSPGAAYFSQFFYQVSIQNNDHDEEMEFSIESVKSIKYQKIGSAFRYLTYALTLLSIIMLGYGGLLFLTVL